MVKYIKLDKEGKLPQFRFKDTIYWIDHDIRHIKESFTWCIKKWYLIFIVSTVLMILYAQNNSWILKNTLKFNLVTFFVLFFTLLFLKILLDKGYSVMGRGAKLPHQSDLNNIPVVPHDFDDKKYENIEKVVKNLNKK